MKTAAEIRKAIEALSPEDLAEFRAWFYEFDVHVPTPEERRAIAKGIAELNAGKFVTSEEIEATFAKFRNT